MKKAYISLGLWFFLVAILFASYPSGGRLLIICPDSWTDEVAPLAKWDTEKGFLTRVVPLSECGSSSYFIRDYIRNAYLHWDVPPEYLLFVGTYDDVLGSPDYPTSDNYYADLEGDFHNELAPGRFFASYPVDVHEMVNKVIHYECHPFDDVGGDSLWILRASLCVNEDGDESDTNYLHCVFHIDSLLLDNGFIEVDTFITDWYHGDMGSNLMASVNEGRGYVIYRGQIWWGFGVSASSMHNGLKNPIVSGTTCSGVGWTSSEGSLWTIGENGGSYRPKVGLSFIGNTSSLGNGAHLRSAHATGFIDGIFLHNMDLGHAANMGRQYAYDVYDPYGRNLQEYKSLQLLTDPTIYMWTQMPTEMDVDYPHVYAVPVGNIHIIVANGGHPITGALVCVMSDTSYYSWDSTGADGSVDFTYNVPDGDTLLLTVTARNHLPYQTHIMPFYGGIYPQVASYSWDDSTYGNGDGTSSRGEELLLWTSVQNYGDSIATGVRVHLISLSSDVLVEDSVVNVGTLDSGEVAVLPAPFRVRIQTSATVGALLPLKLTVTVEGTDSVYERSISAPIVVGAEIALSALTIEDPSPGGDENGILSGGEGGFITISLENSGTGLLTDLRVSITGNEHLYTENDTLSLDILNAGDSTQFTFFAAASPILERAESITVHIFIEGSDGGYISMEREFEQRILLNPRIVRAVGPDGYGWWAYDVGDISTGRAPTYEWIDLPSIGDMLPSISNSSRACTTLALPFTYTFYGVDYDSITVTTEGYLQPGGADDILSAPAGLPLPSAPTPIIASLWTNLNPSISGNVFYYYDEPRGRYIIEYQNVVNSSHTDYYSFEIYLYSLDMRVTPTGDGEVEVHYESVGSLSGVGIGIQNKDGSYGLQYMLNNWYSAGAGTISDEQAIRFTTLPPESLTTPWIVPVEWALSDTLYGDGDGVWTGWERLELSVLIRNIGNQDASDVHCILEDDCGLSIVLDSLEEFSSLAIGGEQLLHYGLRLKTVYWDTTVTLALTIISDDMAYHTSYEMCFSAVPPMGVADNRLPTYFDVSNGYPNPFNSSVSFSVSLPRVEAVFMEMFDIAGHRVMARRTGLLTAGVHTVRYNSDALASGIYLVRIRAGDSDAVRKVVLIR